MNKQEPTLADIYSFMQKMQESMIGLQENMTSMQKDMTGMKADMTGMKSDMTGMKADIADIQEKMATKEDIKMVRSEMAVMKEDLELTQNQILEVMDENFVTKKEAKETERILIGHIEGLTGLSLKNDQEIVMTGNRVARVEERVRILELA
ncbi:TPA: hypothetical protein DEP96_00265 [Candidatus Uhrbacteria bacterium]|nr:hypothetical protein [Candidatus Uhrbacteria bacterium]